MSNEVTLPRSVVVIAASIVVGCLVSVAYLMGRQAATPVPPPAPITVPVAQAPEQKHYAMVPSPDVGRAAPSPAGQPAASSPVARETREAVPSPTPVTREARPAVPSPPPVADAPLPSPTRVDPALRKQVAEYFQAMDKALAVAKKWDTADSVTQAAVANATRRDPRQLKAILDANRAAMVAIRAIVPPAPCRQHHQMAQKVLANATRIVENVASSTITGDLEDLGDDLAPAAGALRSDVAKMREMRADICRQYGIELPPEADRNV